MFGFLQNVTDPVCKMKVKKNKAKFSSEFKGEKYYFCSENCKKQFDADTQDFIAKEDASSCCQNKNNPAGNKSCC